MLAYIFSDFFPTLLTRHFHVIKNSTLLLYQFYYKKQQAFSTCFLGPMYVLFYLEPFQELLKTKLWSECQPMDEVLQFQAGLIWNLLFLRPVPALKVSKYQNEIMMSSFRPKNERNFLRISALASKKRLDQKIKALYITN